MDFGEKIKKLRENLGLNQKQIAEKLNIPRTTYSGYEHGRREPDFETLKKIAVFFDCSIDYLLDISTDKKSKVKDVQPNIMFANRMKKKRESLNMTQNDLSIILGIPKEIIIDYENGEDFPDLNLLSNISVTLNTTSDYLIGVSDNPNVEYKIFTDRLKDIMIKEEITKENLSKQTKIGKSTLEEYLNGTVSPDIDALKKIATVLNTTIDYLAGLTNKSEYEELQILEGKIEVTENGKSKFIPIKDLLAQNYNINPEDLKKFISDMNKKK